VTLSSQDAQALTDEAGDLLQRLDRVVTRVGELAPWTALSSNAQEAAEALAHLHQCLAYAVDHPHYTRTDRPTTDDDQPCYDSVACRETGWCVGCAPHMARAALRVGGLLSWWGVDDEQEWTDRYGRILGALKGERAR